jgi:parallel beta-helix repeat protein
MAGPAPPASGPAIAPDAATTAPGSTSTPGGSTNDATPTARTKCAGVAMTQGQADIDANDSATTFCISGTHSWSLVPKDGDVFIGGTLDGGGTLVRAFSGNASSVTISNVRVNNYDPPKYGGAIDANGDGWTLRNVTVSGSSFVGVAVGGTDWLIQGGRLHDNGQLGVRGKGQTATSMTIDGVEIDHNGFTDSTYSARQVPCVNGAGGVKFEANNVTVENSFIHDNGCEGILSDLGADQIALVNNRIDDNWDEGIFIDISGNATVQGNEISGNGFNDSQGTAKLPCGPSFGSGGGIYINTSGQTHTVTGSIDVGFNNVAMNCNGVTAVDQVRTANGCAVAPVCDLRNVTIHDNTIVESIVSGAANQAGWFANDNSDLTTHNLSWLNNVLSAGIVMTPISPPTTTTTTTVPTESTTSTTVPDPTTTTAPSTTTTTTTTPPTGTNPYGPSGAWTPAFADEFNGTSLDRTKWNTWGTWERDNGGRSNIGNGELDYNTDGANFSFGGGALTIQARREPAPNGMAWTSGQIGSAQAFTYGYVETRAKFASPKGFLNALWTWGAPGTNASGQETDAYEFYSDNHLPVYLTARTPGGGGCQGLRLGFDPTVAMHVYGSDIEPTGTDWYIDGVKVCHADSAPTQPWNVVDYMTVNATTRAPIADVLTTHAEYVIDYIRVWHR